MWKWDSSARVVPMYRVGDDFAGAHVLCTLSRTKLRLRLTRASYSQELGTCILLHLTPSSFAECSDYGSSCPCDFQWAHRDAYPQRCARGRPVSYYVLPPSTIALPFLRTNFAFLVVAVWYRSIVDSPRCFAGFLESWPRVNCHSRKK